MPGKIFKVLLGPKDDVKKGDPVLIVEAMKMEHTIRATKDGIIKEIFFNEGDQVQGGVLLCEIE
jgi:biotin carboxyl carrier protein